MGTRKHTHLKFTLNNKNERAWSNFYDADFSAKNFEVVHCTCPNIIFCLITPKCFGINMYVFPFNICMKNLYVHLFCFFHH